MEGEPYCQANFVLYLCIIQLITIKNKQYGDEREKGIYAFRNTKQYNYIFLHYRFQCFYVLDLYANIWMGVMIHLALILKGDSAVWLYILGFIFVLFILPHIMGAAFDKADKEAQEGNGSCLGAIFIGVLILVVVGSILQIKSCSTHDYYPGEWEPRHTQYITPTHNNINSTLNICKV